MSDFWSGVGGGVGGAVGGFLSNDMNRSNADHAADRADWQAEHQMRFQEVMSNTAHQREVLDLRAAGLNPMLSVDKGASTPSGASGGVPMAAPADIGGKMITSAMDAMRLGNDLETGKKARDLMQAQGTASTAAALASTASAKMTDQNREALTAQMEAIKKKAQYDQKQYDWDTKMINYDNISKRVGEATGIIKNGRDALNPFKLFDKGNGGVKPWQGKLPDGTVFDRGTGEIVP